MELPRFGGERLSQQVVRELEWRIVTGELRSGERLPTEAELCELLGVSRSVIRDAMRTLSARGLVVIRQGHGMAVSPPDDSAVGDAILLRILRSDLSVADVVVARGTLETALVPLAAKTATEEDWQAMDDRLVELAAAIKKNDWETATSEHLAFHLALVSALHLPALEFLLKPMQQTILLTSLPLGNDRKDFYDEGEHRRILDALRARDEDAVRDALEKHFAYIRERRYDSLRQKRFADISTIEDYLFSLSVRPA